MKRQIRRGTFETNSSSVHNLQIMNADDFDKWNDNGLYVYEGSDCYWDDKSKAPLENSVYTKEEAIAFINSSKWPPEEGFNFEDEDEVEELLRENEFYSPDYYFDNDYYESFSQEYTTPSGDKIVCFGYYGHD